MKPAATSGSKEGSHMTEKVLYAELTPREFRARLAAAPIAYLPLGTLEWHGEHLPLGSDGIQSQGFFVQLAKRAGGIVLPMLFLGPDLKEEQPDGSQLCGMDILAGEPGPGQYAKQQLTGSAYWIAEEDFGVLLEDVLRQLSRAGFRIVVAHGHGPSTMFFAKHSDQYRQEFGLTCLHLWEEGSADPLARDLGIQTDHAAANETSLVMALRPDLVQMENLPKDRWPMAVSGKDPRIHASREVGQKAIARNVDRMATVLRETLAAASR
jgi:creatinine amidohydrolase